MSWHLLYNWSKEAGREIGESPSRSLLMFGNVNMGVCFHLLSTFYVFENVHNKKNFFKYNSSHSPCSTLHSQNLRWTLPFAYLTSLAPCLFPKRSPSSIQLPILPPTDPVTQGKVTPILSLVSADLRKPSLLTVNDWFWKDVECKERCARASESVLPTLLEGL